MMLTAVPKAIWHSSFSRQHCSALWSAMRCVGLVFLVSVATASGARADEIDNYVAIQMSKQHIPGLSLAVLKDGTPVKVKGYGVSNLELNTPASPESSYMIGSISKQFLAAGIMLLIQDGRVSLADSVRKYLQDAPETWQIITVRHLLTHTSGLTTKALVPGFDPLKPKSDAEVIRASYGLPLDFKPGEKFAYSNLGYFVLAEIIYRAAQKPWPEYLHERIFAPLGMNATRTTTLEELVPNRADGYEWKDGAYRHGETLIGVRPSGAFLSSVHDLAKWDAALYTDSPFRQQQRELLWTPVRLNDGTEKPYGFGWNVGTVGKHRHVHHAGTIAGFRSEITRFVDDRLTVIVLTNAGQALPEQIALGVAALYIPDLLPKRKTVTLSNETLDSYAGQYQLTGGRMLNITRVDGRLRLVLTVGKTSLDLGLMIPESDTRFFNQDDPRNTYIFSTDAQGRKQIAVEDQNGKLGPPTPKLDPPK